MAITDIAAYAHLSEADIEALGFELDSIRCDIEESLGENDAAYIQRTIKFQRTLDVVARLVIGVSRSRAGWLLGTATLAFAKSVENMEISHNVLHGQWDWMNDPEIHSSTWEWDMVGLSSQWRYSHNYRHHVFSNVLGMDDDLGFGVMRVTRDQPWKPQYLLQPLQNLFLAATFEWGIALHDVDFDRVRAATAAEKATQASALIGKVARQAAKDYVLFPGAQPISVAQNLGCECDGQPCAQPVGVHGDLLWALPRRRREVHRRRTRTRNPSRVVPAADAGFGELQSRPAAGVLERQLVLSDRAPPVPRPAE